MKFSENIERKKEQKIYDWVQRLEELGENIRAPQLSKIKFITAKPIEYCSFNQQTFFNSLWGW